MYWKLGRVLVHPNKRPLKQRMVNFFLAKKKKKNQFFYPFMKKNTIL
ncbi:hypothetical protein LEP1GSC196_2500 [Leptospira meyeri serovar Semaranga str. Veldrot Semarang 173]|nr:hypothetical protein LEP1GSC196_2500 [Leptospira meyeri serovar Semaranga str. Veldrot Semarang 173]